MFQSVWTAALSAALGSGPVALPPQHAHPAPVPHAVHQIVAAPVARQAAPPRILHHPAAVPIAQQQYYQYSNTPPVQYYRPVAPQWQPGYAAPQHQLFVPPPPGYTIVPVGAELPAPAPPAEIDETVDTSATEAATEVAQEITETQPDLNGYLQEISSYVGPGFRTYSYQPVSDANETCEPIEGESCPAACAEEELRKHLTKVGAAAYAAELAKLRAQHDYHQLSHTAPVNHTARPTQLNVPPAPAPLAVDRSRPVPAPIAPANFQPPSRIEQLKQQLEQQTLRLQALQGAVQKQQQVAQPQPQQVRTPQKKARRGLLYQIFDR